MKQTKLVWSLIVITIIIVSTILIRMNFTGFSVLEDKVTSVIRLIETNESTNLTYINIAIISSENVIAIQENLTENCSVLDYYLEPEIDIFEFNENEIIWLLANRSSSLNIELSYTIPIHCFVLNGFYYIITENETIESYGISSEANPPQSQPQPQSTPPGGGSSTSAATTPTPQLTSQPITQASDRQEYDQLKQEAENKVEKNLKSKENPQANIYYSPIFIILTTMSLVIIIFLIISFTRKPK